MVANFTAQELRPAQPRPGIQFEAAWKAEDLHPTDDAARLTVPAKNGVLLWLREKASGSGAGASREPPDQSGRVSGRSTFRMELLRNSSGRSSGKR